MMLWRNGVLEDIAHVRIAPDDRGFTLGDGVFETLRVHDGDVLHGERHLHRFRIGAALLGIKVAFDDPTIIVALARTLRANGTTSGSLRLTLSRGPAPRGIATPDVADPTFLISASSASLPSAPASLIISNTTRRNELSPLSRIKSLNYLDSILARREAEACGADDALLLNTQMRVAEATASTLIAALDGVLVTPPVGDGALPGIARGLLLERQVLLEAPLDVTRLRQAKTLLLCNSLGVRGVTALDGAGLQVRPDLVSSLAAILLTR